MMIQGLKGGKVALAVIQLFQKGGLKQRTTLFLVAGRCWRDKMKVARKQREIQ